MNLPLIPTVSKPGLLELDGASLRAWLAEQGEKPLRARQIRRWLLVGGAESFDQMTDLPLALRQRLADRFVPLATRVIRHQRSTDNTHKLLVQLADGKLVECVLIQDDGRRTACVSTQVGCGMGCVFCASGLNGVERNLTPAEIVEQLVRLRNLPSAPSPLGGEGRGEGGQHLSPGQEISAGSLAPSPQPSPPRGEGAKLTPSPSRGEGAIQAGSAPERLTNIVVMGMGEPLANLDNLLAALEVATAKDGLGIGARHITISSVGLPAKIRRLADLGKQYHLAVSLHAPNDAVRAQIVPTNDKTGLRDILDAADYFFATTGRQVTYEYVLLHGLNDDASHARELTRLLRGRKAHVNLIPFNDVEGLPYRRPTTEALTAFIAPLRQHGISVKVRKRKGADIDAACGQLRRSVQSEVPAVRSP